MTINPKFYIHPSVVIQEGAIIGNEGLQLTKINGLYHVVPHHGGVIIQEGVRIQAGVVINRGLNALDDTIIGAFTMVGDLSMIAHNAHIGKNCFIGPHSMICGSVTVGDNCYIQPSVTIGAKVRIGNGVSIMLGSVVTQDVPDGGKVAGNWAINYQHWVTHIKTITAAPILESVKNKNMRGR